MLDHTDYALYLITEPYLPGKQDQYFHRLEQALKGGVDVLQFREKKASRRDMYKLAQGCQELTKRFHIPFIINDQVDLALALDADGVHVGQEDLPIKIVRKLLAPGKVVGVSVSTLDEAVQAEHEGADYLGVGSMFYTSTKPDAIYTSLEELRRIQENVSLPLIAIGGINAENVAVLKQHGADGYAIITAILHENDPFAAVRELRDAINGA